MGELCLRGPMVTTGYRGSETQFLEAQNVWRSGWAGKGRVGAEARYFKTSDMVWATVSSPFAFSPCIFALQQAFSKSAQVTLLGDSLEFRGRSDMLVKAGLGPSVPCLLGLIGQVWVLWRFLRICALERSLAMRLDSESNG